MRTRVNGQKIANIVGVVVILSMMLAIVPSGLAPVTAAPPQSPPSGPTAQNGVAYTLRIHGTGWSRPNVPIEGDSRAGDLGARDPALGTLPEDPPYTEPMSVFDPEGPQAPTRDSVTFNPVWMYEGATRDENWAKGLYQKILTPINASEKVWLRMWYEPEHWDKDLNGNGILDIAAQRWEFEPTMPVTDVWYPALMQEFTYLLMDGKQLTSEPPPFPTWGNVGTSFVFPIGMKSEDLFTPTGAVDISSANAQFGYGLTSLDGNFDGAPDIVHVESEGSLYALTSIAADFDGDGFISRLDRDGTSLNGTELAVLRLGATDVERGKGIQFLDHLAMVEQVSDNGVQLGIYYTGDLTPRPFPSVTLQIGDMVLAGSQGPAQLIRAVRNGTGINYTSTNMGKGVPTGPWFVYLQGVDRDENQAILIVGRALGATHSAMEDGMYREDKRPSDPWFLKRFYVDGHEYNVVSLMTRNGGAWGGGAFGPYPDLDLDNDGFIDPAFDPYTLLPDLTQFQFITLRTSIPKTSRPVEIRQHSVYLQNYLPNDNLSVLPPYNYEHYYIQDINAITKFSEYDIWDPVQQRWEISVNSVGRLVGPVAPILQKNKTLPYAGYGPNSPYTDARETSLYYVEEAKNPQYLGMLREMYSELGTGQFWSTRQFMTVPWWYTDVVFPDVREAITGRGQPDLYLLKSVFFNYQSERRYWLRTAPDWADLLGIAQPPEPIMFWFDPAVGGKKYKDTEGLRVYGELIYGEPVLGEMQPWTWPDGILGNKGAGDVLAFLDRLATYPAEILPYTDPLAPFDPDHPQAPRKDFVTLNPAYMNEYENGGEPLVNLYRQISIREGNAGEKVFARMWYEPSYVDKLVRADLGARVFTPTEVMMFPAVMQEFTYMYLDMNDQPSSGQPGKSQFAFPVATGANELPRPVGGSIPGAQLPSFGYGLTTFDVDFDGTEDTVTIHSEATLQQVTGIAADFDGDAVIDNLDADGAALSGDELVIFSKLVHLQRGQSAQLLDHMVSLANIATPATQADLTLWYTGGGMHPGNSKHPDLVLGSPITLREREMAIVSSGGYRRLSAGGSNAGGLNGAWFVYVDQINSATETVNLIIGRALGATHSAIDDGAGGHDLVAGDPWYLKRFFVDGHEYNVVALMTVPNTYGYPNEDPFEFKYITVRTPVPKPEDFENYEDSQILQGYGIQSVISMMPPFNYQHTVREDILAMPETWNNPNPLVIPANRTELTLGNPAYMLATDPNCIGGVLTQRPPLRISIVDEAREPQFFGDLKELYYISAGPLWRWKLTEYRSSPDKYTELRFPAGEKYLLTTDWWWYNMRQNFECTQYLPPVGSAQLPVYRTMFWYDPTDPKDIYINRTTTCGAPQANFSATPTQGQAPLTVNFTDTSVGNITSWSWNFGDGGTSNQQNPSHVYTQPGAFTVTLTVSGPCGVDTETKVEYIVVTTCALIRVSPLTQTVGVGQTVAVDIRVEGVSNLYGVDVQLSFDYTKVQVVDDDGATPGTQITPGPFLNPASGFVQTNSANNGTGVVRYTFTLQNPAPPVSGSGVVATIHFIGVSTGTANLAFTLGQLVNKNAVQLCSTTQGGSLEVVITTGSISGTVSLQSRTNHSGVSVTAGVLPPVSTGTNGTFTVAGVPPATYTVVASKAGYLPARKTGVVVPPSGSVNIGSVMMLGGDANNDGTINIVDLVIVGAMYGYTPPIDGRADINGDGTCNLIDLVLVGANYGKVGPTDWVALAAGEVEAQRSTSKLSFSPSFRILPVGETTMVEVVASSVADLYAGEFEVSYDPKALSVADMDANTEGIQIGVGDVFGGNGAFVAVNSVDAAAGKIRFAATLLDPSPAIQGSVVLARIPFKALKSGPSMLRFSNAQLLTLNAATLDVKVNDGSLWLGPIRGMGSEPTQKMLRIQ